jgi:drug/metabolite transporter (DMT)-like permease
MGLRVYTGVRAAAEALAPLLLLCVVQTIFSGYVILTSASLGSSNVSPLVFAFLRDSMATGLFVTTLTLRERLWPTGQPLVPRREHYGHIIALGLLAVFGTQLLGVLAIRNLSAAVYGFLTPTVPVVTLLVSYALGLDVFRPRELASWAKVGGIAVTLAGAVFIVGFATPVEADGDAGARGHAHGQTSPLGIAYIIAQKMSAGTYPLLQKHMLSRFGYGSLHLATWAYVVGTAFVGLNVATSAVSQEAWDIDATAAAGILYSGALSAFFNYAAMAWVNARTSPVTVIAFYPLQSLLTPILASAFLKTPIATTDIVGGAIIVVGLFVCVWGMYAHGAPSTGVIEAGEDAEAVSVVLTFKDLAAIADAGAASAAVGGTGSGGGRSDIASLHYAQKSADKLALDLAVVPDDDDGPGSGGTVGDGGRSAATPIERRLKRAESLAVVAAPILERAFSTLHLDSQIRALDRASSASSSTSSGFQGLGLGLGPSSQASPGDSGLHERLLTRSASRIRAASASVLGATPGRLYGGASVGGYGTSGDDAERGADDGEGEGEGGMGVRETRSGSASGRPVPLMRRQRSVLGMLGT